jgi:DNA-binding Lrp family transcriptional regulator
MDRFDIALLEALQSDSRRSMNELGEQIGLSSSACHRRIRALEDAGRAARRWNGSRRRSRASRKYWNAI